jgi:WD40 repeat protein
MLATVPLMVMGDAVNLDSGEKIKDLGGYGGSISDAEFSADGQYLVADLASGLYLWQISDGTQLWEAAKNSMAAIYSPDGKYLAYSDIGDGNKIILASPDATRIIRTIGEMQSPVWELFFSADSSLLAAKDGREIRIWRVEDGTLLSVGKSNCP